MTILLIFFQKISDKRIKILSYGKKYGSSSANFYRLIREISFKNYDYIALSDHDDIWDKLKIDQAIRLMDKNSSSAYSSNLKAFWDNSDKKKIIKKNFKFRKYDFLFESASAGCTFVFTKEFGFFIQESLCDKELMIEEISSHDWAIYALARIGGFKWVCDSRAHINYRQHQNNVAGANVGIFAFLKRLKNIMGWYKKDHRTILKLYNKLNKDNQINLWALIRSPLSLRRKSADSLAIFFLKTLRII